MSISCKHPQKGSLNFEESRLSNIILAYKNVRYNLSKYGIIYLFTFEKFTKLVREKYPLLQLDCNKYNHTQIYTEKNGPNKRLIKKVKNQTICSPNF